MRDFDRIGRRPVIQHRNGTPSKFEIRSNSLMKLDQERRGGVSIGADRDLTETGIREGN